MPLPRPRTIRGQLMGALVLFEIIVLVIFTVLLVHQQNRELDLRLRRSIENQALLIASEGSMAVADGHLESFQRVVTDAALAPSVSAAQITDLQGRTLASTDPTMKGKLALTVREQKHLGSISTPVIFSGSANTWEAVAPILDHGRTRYLVWIYPDTTLDRQDLRSLLKITALWAIFVMASYTAIGAILAQSITRQLAVLARATRRLVQDPESTGEFPLPVSSSNEAGDLTIAFNRMVAAIQEQRAGLSETLALLDSMLANAPIGFAFFDRKYRFVRVNQFLADMNGYSFALHLGRGVNGVLPPSAAEKLEEGIEAVFEKGEPLRDLELNWETDAGRARSWMAHLYPVRTEAESTRWVGAILVDTTEERRAEEALRRTEKLAAAGRLAASIAHEINNPLEAVTNLLFLIRQENLSPSALRFVDMAQQEVSRVSEITQQTLRFYRQSTLPAQANVGELLNSVLTLHQGRIQTLQVQVVRDFTEEDSLFCFSGELRQLFANFIGNALDAMMPGGGTLTIRVRHVSEAGRAGIRVTIVDTGSGISPEARRHIFEPFFTTKEATGTGLGLWVSEQIIRKHHGVVRVRSCVAGPRHGTVFSVFFPSDGLAQREKQQEIEEESAVAPRSV